MLLFKSYKNTKIFIYKVARAMKKIVLITFLVTSLNHSFAAVVQLTNIFLFNQKEGQAPLDIIIRSSDSVGKVEMNDGSTPGVQEKDFNIKDLKSFTFTVPWGGWDGDATIHVKVFRGKELISQMDLQDRNATLIVKGIKNAQALTLSKKKITGCTYDCSSTEKSNCITDLSHCSFGNEELDMKIQLAVNAATGVILIKSIEQFDQNSQRITITQRRFA